MTARLNYSGATDRPGAQPGRPATPNARANAYIRYGVLLALKGFALVFYRGDAKSIDGRPLAEFAWQQIRLICFLNHTSLFEPLFVAIVPNELLWQIATRAVVPIAQVTLDRPIVGFVLRRLVAQPVPISREADHTWDALMAAVREDSMVIIMPEGRMRRATGLDRDNRPMTARGGVTQILERLKHGGLLMAYSGGLHHVQAPGERFPRLFKTLRMRFEMLDISSYLAAMHERAGVDGRHLRNAIKTDLDSRRDRFCPCTPESTRQPGSDQQYRVSNDQVGSAWY